MNGDDKAWREMKKYQVQDVVLLEELYQVLLPWLPGSSSVTVKERREIADIDGVV
jgi:hypothetical protein